MEPTLSEGDWLLVRRTSRVSPGDVVVLERPDRPGLLVVKRIVAGSPSAWWVQGDNPAASDDSRAFGAVGSVLGRVILRYRPRPRLIRRQHQRVRGH
jgi:nickel-type superoxide dismutase maturation protease